MRKKPLIGIAPYIVSLPNRPNVFGTYRTYVESIEKAGGIPMILSPNPALIPEYAKRLDGLLLTGGDDIHPRFFREKLPKFKITPSPDERTSFEIKLVQKFIKTKKPILGVCLGCQTLNIALGGKLIQDIQIELPKTKNHKAGVHRIWVDQHSKLKKITGKNELNVNSRHHQSIKTVGKNLRVTAISPDGVIEAIEAKQHPFLLGVQWHPEIAPQRPESKKLFTALVQSSKN